MSRFLVTKKVLENIMELLQNLVSYTFNHWYFDYHKLYSSYKLLYFDDLPILASLVNERNNSLRNFCC